MVNKTKFLGLSQSAHDWMESVNTFSSRRTGNVLTGVYNEHVYDLREYTIGDGREIEEFAQDEIWSIAPVIFIALRFKDTKTVIPESLWTEDEIKAHN